MSLARPRGCYRARLTTSFRCGGPTSCSPATNHRGARRGPALVHHIREQLRHPRYCKRRRGVALPRRLGRIDGRGRHDQTGMTGRVPQGVAGSPARDGVGVAGAACKRSRVKRRSVGPLGNASSRPRRARALAAGLAASAGAGCTDLAKLGLLPKWPDRSCLRVRTCMCRRDGARLAAWILASLWRRRSAHPAGRAGTVR